MEIPALIIPAYNRPATLQRLLDSLVRADYLGYNVPLIISIDGGGDQEVLNLARRFVWRFGKKEIIERETNLGLRDHIVRCADLSDRFGSLIMLEDDILVGPRFFDYALQAIPKFAEDQKIAGISLYGYQYSENGLFPFEPVDDGSDVYFMQIAASWGQAWTFRQWRKFREWWRENPEEETVVRLPAYIEKWGAQSWKKQFIRYLIATGKYFAFPRRSHTTNPGDPGTHTDVRGIFQVPLAQGAKQYQFAALTRQSARYDAHFEPAAQCIQKIAPDLAAHAFDVDLYGTKRREDLGEALVLTTRPAKKAVMRFGLELFPAALNLQHEISGDAIHLASPDDVDFRPRAPELNHYRVQPLGKYIFHATIEAEAAKKAEIIADAMTNEKANRLFAEWAERERQNAAHPKLTVVIADTGDAAKLKLSIESVLGQDYPNAACIVAGEEGSAGMALEARPGLSFLAEPKGTGTEAALLSGLAEVQGEAASFLVAGDRLQAGSLAAVGAIFKRFPEVHWAMGVAAPSENLRKFRWNARQFRKARLQTILGYFLPGQVWMRRSFLQDGKDLGAPGHSLPEVLARLIRRQAPYTVNRRLADSRVLQSSGAGFETARGHLRPERGPVVRLLARLFKPFYLLNIPGLRFPYLEFDRFPEVVRFHAPTKAWYLSRY